MVSGCVRRKQGQSGHIAELLAFARKALIEGYKNDALVSLAGLLNPALVERVIERYWDDDGTEPATYTIDSGVRLAEPLASTRLHATLRRSPFRQRQRQALSSNRRFLTLEGQRDVRLASCVQVERV